MHENGERKRAWYSIELIAVTRSLAYYIVMNIKRFYEFIQKYIVVLSYEQ